MLPLLLLGCDPWNLPGDAYFYLDEPTWDPEVVAAADGVYVNLPAADQLVRIEPDGTQTLVDLRGASVERMVLGPDGETLLVWSKWPVCADDDPKIRLVADCDPEDLSTEHELNYVRDGATFAEATTVVPYQYNAVGFNPSGTLAATWLDFSQAGDIEVDGVLNLTEAVFVPMDGREPQRVSVGFAPENVLFTTGDPERAVVLSRSQVAVVDLESFAVTVTYPLALDADQEVTPTDVVLTPDGNYALVSVQGRSDLYVLDLLQESIDLVELNGVPSDLLVDPAADRTVIVYSGQRTVDVLEHEYFELESFELDEPADSLMSVDGKALLYNADRSYKDVYLFDIATGEVVEYRAENPVMDMRLTASQTHAVATLDVEGGGGGGVSGYYDSHYGIGVFDLTDDRSPISLVLEGRPVGLALVESDGVDTALVLSDGVDSLLRIGLADGGNDPVELSEPPLGISALPDSDQFVITEDSPLGIIGFLGAGDDEVVEHVGFATTDLFRDYTLPRRSE